MKINNNAELGKLSNKINPWCNTSEIFDEHKIPYVELWIDYDDDLDWLKKDAIKVLEFGHRYGNENIVSFKHSCGICFVFGSAEKIIEILEKELKKLEEDQ